MLLRCRTRVRLPMTALVPALLDVLLAAMPAIALSSTEPECTLNDFHACLQSLQAVTGNDLAFAATRLELEASCGTVKESLKCVDDHMRQCFTATQRKVFNHVVAGARQVAEDLCVPGPMQEGYLRHAPCFKNISLAEDKCAPKYRRLLELSEHVNERQNVDEGLRESCCAFSEFVLCKHLHVTRDCGVEAGEYLQQHLDRISSPLIHEHCAHYTYGTDSCSGGASGCFVSWLSTLIVGVVAAATTTTVFFPWTFSLLKNDVT